MSNTKILQTDPIAESAQFWQTYDLPDFEDELEEVAETVFVCRDEPENENAETQKTSRAI